MSLRYENEELLFAKNTKLSDVIKENKGHACYVYDLANIEKRYKALAGTLSGFNNLGIHYALKANANPEVLSCLKSLGAQVDIVSGGEMSVALANGFSAKDIIFSGVAKSVDEVTQAIDNDIKQINVESPQELIRIGEIAQAKNKKISVAFRMNPEVSPETHPYITTGMSENKFGMDAGFVPELVRILKKYPDHIHLRGLTMHIGSQILELGVMGEAIHKIRSIYKDLQALGYPLGSLDIGGGVGIHYQKDSEEEDFKIIETYGKIVRDSLKDFKDELIIEPGRVLVGRCGVLLCQVEYIKETSMKSFAIVNTGMHHLLRPALYQANHRIMPLSKKEGRLAKVYDVVGPICESSDFLGKNRPMPLLKQGDYLAICDAGAYGFSMASTYNAHELPVEFAV